MSTQWSGSPTGGQDPLPRLMAQWVNVPITLNTGTHMVVLQRSATKAVELLRANAAKEGKTLREPIMLRIVAEAFTEQP